MYEDVEDKLKKKNKILFSMDSDCLKVLSSLLQLQTHKTLILWAFERASEIIPILEKKYPMEKRPRLAYEICQQWASGEVKMPVAKRAILDCHAFAKDIDDKVDIAFCHAIGQGLSTVHVRTHAIGLPIYELTALVHKYPDLYEIEIEKKIEIYIQRLHYFQENSAIIMKKWASFLE